MGSLIRTDLSLFEDRIDEITSKTNYSEVKDTISMLKNELHKNKDLVCLCAPQINKKLRIFVVKNSDNKYKAFLNPMIVNASKELHLSREANASIPNKEFIIPRKNEVHVAYQQPNGRVESETYSGAYSEVIQQMIEMLDGITLLDYGLDLDSVGGPKKFDKATKKDKQTVIEMYLDNLKNLSKDFEDEINNNEELKNLNDTIKFQTKLLTGEIKPIDSDGNIIENYSPKGE